MSNFVLDASALLALLQDEPGGDRVLTSLPGALISSVNLSEVVAKLAELGMPESDIRLALSLGLDVVPFDVALAFSAGALRPATRSMGLSLGDRACLALARSRSLPALTTDRAWRDIDINVEVEVIRPD
ncbi:MAG: type II toxin-antitoxin system VapC family toxin [Thermoanaerobaculales bacterium]|nr:type II toxin-antitoxin system VapC family toxin [Thermoanaerobaculales bacterium]